MENQNLILIRVNVDDVLRFIKIDKCVLKCPLEFYSIILSAYNIVLKESDEFEVTDQLNTPIDLEILEEVVLKYEKCSDFVLKLVFKGNVAKMSMMNEKLKSHIETNGFGNLFAEQIRIGYLTYKSRKTIVRCIVEIIESKFTLAATEVEIAEVCKAAIALFPSLCHSPSICGGIDLLFSYETSSGWVYEALKYRKRIVSNRIQELAEADVANLNISNNEPNQRETVLAQMEQCLNGFILPRDLQKLKEYLKNTVESRRRVLHECVEGYPDLFLFYLTNPELILFDFKLFFPDVDEKSLLKRWNNIKSVPFENFKEDLRSETVNQCVHQNSDMYNFLSFLKMFPTHKIKFEKAFKALLEISEDVNCDPMIFLGRVRYHPFIICIVGEEQKFYIAVRQRLISVPLGFSFVQVIDLFYKIHKVFHVPFDKSIQQLMCFVGHFIFNCNEDKQSLTGKSKEKIKRIPLIRQNEPNETADQCVPN